MKEYGIVDSGDKLKLGIGAMTDQRWSDFYHTMVKAGSSRRASTIRRSAPSSSPTTASASICARALARKPGALRNGAPFKDWVLPAALDRVRRKLAGSDDGDRQMVKILAAVLSDGLAVVEAACVQALAESVHSAGHSQHPGASPRSEAVSANPHPGIAAVASCAGRRLRPIRSLNPWNEPKSST
jgi:hypothetical protein